MVYKLSEQQIRNQVTVILLDCLAAVDAQIPFDEFAQKIGDDTIQSLNISRDQKEPDGLPTLEDLAVGSFSVKCILNDPLKFFGMLAARSYLIGLDPRRPDPVRHLVMTDIGSVTSYVGHDPKAALAAVVQAICEGLLLSRVDLFKMREEGDGTQWRVFGLFHLVGAEDSTYTEKIMTPVGTTFSGTGGRYTKEIQEFALWISKHYAVPLEWKDYDLAEFTRQTR